MALTTLFTFTFDCPSAARTIELLGSWDNFAKPYNLKQDLRRGYGIWSGCFSFEDIICDGDFSALGGKRSGGLMMGGTYWYYVNDEEHHDPAVPSTTICPLLPGQRLNVLEVPIESESQNGPDRPDAFTRNPNDKFLTPVPPKGLPASPSPRLGEFCREKYTPPMFVVSGPRSATYPPPSKSLAPTHERHARSASTSPHTTSTTVFTDLKFLREKLGSSKRSRSVRRNAKEIKISAPTLISTTAEDMNVIPLPSSRIVPSPASTPFPVAARIRGFSPLRSNPVDPLKDFDFGFTQPASDAAQTTKRPRSHRSSSSPSEIHTVPGRERANSSDIRRTRIYVYPNEPWVTSPLQRHCPQPMENPAPVLQRPPESLASPSDNARPATRSGDKNGPGLPKSSPLNKELPPLPRYLVPAPLFACNDTSTNTDLHVEEQQGEHDKEAESQDALLQDRSNRLSAWSNESVASSTSPPMDEDAMRSPTCSSMTSDSSNFGTPQRSANPFTSKDHVYENNLGPDADPTHEGEELVEPQSTHEDPVPLLQLPVQSFGPEKFHLDDYDSTFDSFQHTSYISFAGSQTCSIKPEDSVSQGDRSSQITITTDSRHPTPTESAERFPSVSQLEKLMREFGYLGDAVV